MAKVSEIQRAIQEFERQRDILQRCIDALMTQRLTERTPRTKKATLQRVTKAEKESAS
jgi:hypothetical protein